MASDKSKTYLKKDDNRSYLNKEFNSFRSDLLQYAQTFFPDRIRDFSEPSMGGMFLDLAAYIGDVMSFYMDHQFNELNIETATEIKNIEKLDRSSGVKIQGAAPASANVSFYIEIDADSSSSSGVKTSDLPVIKEGTILQSSTGIIFTLLEDVDFTTTDAGGNYLWETDIGNKEVFTLDSSSNPATYSLMLSGIDGNPNCRSGKQITEKFNIPDTFTAFRTIRLGAPDVSEILDVRDSDGNIYYEVESLTQNVVYKRVININVDNDEVPDNLELLPAPYRFVASTTSTSRLTSIRFGSGQAATLDDDIIPDPSELAMPLYQKKTFSRFSIDPNDLLRTRTLGISPQGTVITVTYRAGGGQSHNVSAKSIRTVSSLQTSFNSSVSAATVSRIRSSVEVINQDEASGGESAPSLTEFRTLALAAKNSQSRIVTKADLIARVYTMPSNFGRVYRIGISSNDENPLATQLHIISRNKDGELTTSPDALKDNLRTYLNEHRLISDAIDILDVDVINLSVTYNVVCDDVSNKSLVVEAANSKLKQYLRIQNFQVEQPLVLTDLQNMIINTDGVVSLVDFSVGVKSGTDTETGNTYSDVTFDIDSYTDRGIVYTTTGAIFEVKYPDDDIIGMSI